MTGPSHFNDELQKMAWLAWAISPLEEKVITALTRKGNQTFYLSIDMIKFIIPHNSIIKKEDRQILNGHRSFILWFTGISGSGKSTLAYEVERILFKFGMRTYVLDGDNVRTGLNKDLGFSYEEREENIRRISTTTLSLS